MNILRITDLELEAIVWAVGNFSAGDDEDVGMPDRRDNRRMRKAMLSVMEKAQRIEAMRDIEKERREEICYLRRGMSVYASQYIGQCGRRRGREKVTINKDGVTCKKCLDALKGEE